MRSIPLNVTVEAVDGTVATLRTESGHAFSMDAARLPPRCAPGTGFCLALEDAAGWDLKDEHRESLAQAMLHELLTTQ